MAPANGSGRAAAMCMCRNADKYTLIVLHKPSLAKYAQKRHKILSPPGRGEAPTSLQNCRYCYLLLLYVRCVEDASPIVKYLRTESSSCSTSSRVDPSPGCPGVLVGSAWVPGLLMGPGGRIEAGYPVTAHQLLRSVCPGGGLPSGTPDTPDTPR